ncbi:MAG: adenylyltransferase/cytidyltransferase family protein [Bacteroidetes bacterium]|nr:adenylyltransferase/cytidyltransferase family protein [Bacteroidota bacterium]
MRVFRNILEAKGIIQNAIITIGSFDGVHEGHKVIINRLIKLAKETCGESVLITFNPHPRKVLYPEYNDLKLVNSVDEKIFLLQSTGLDNLIIHPFDKNFANTSSVDFIINYLVKCLDVKVVVTGPNHHFGKNREGDQKALSELGEKHGFKLEGIPLKDIENETISSGKVRDAILNGDFVKANRYLGFNYLIIGKIFRSEKADSNKWFIEIEEKEKLLPPDGIYDAEIIVDEKRIKIRAKITSISSTEKEVMIISQDVCAFSEGQIARLLFI